MSDIGSYLAAIDFRVAVVVALVVGVVAMLVRRFILATAEEGLIALPWIGSWIARSALSHRRDLPTSAWFCTTCRSLNPPAASLCYRGCGPRVELEAGGLPTDAPVEARGGTSRRRG